MIFKGGILEDMETLFRSWKLRIQSTTEDLIPLRRGEREEVCEKRFWGGYRNEVVTTESPPVSPQVFLESHMLSLFEHKN